MSGWRSATAGPSTALLVTMLAAATASAPAAAQGQDVVEPACRVPDLEGKTLLQIDYHGLLSGLSAPAERACTLGRVKLRDKQRAPAGRPLVVVSQSPGAGAVVSYRTAVSVVLARAQPARPGRCRVAPGSELITKTRAMVIYRTFAPEPLDGLDRPLAKPTWRACVRSSGKRRAIYTPTAGDGTRSSLSQFTVSGNYVAYTIDLRETKYTGGDVYRNLVIFDVRTGKQTFTTQIGRTFVSNPTGEPPAPDVLDIAVNAAGFAAWTTRDSGGTSLHVHDSRREALVDRATTGSITNLRLHGNSLTWSNAGTPRETMLT